MNKFMNKLLAFEQVALMVLAVMSWLKGNVEVGLIDIVIVLQVEGYKE